MPRRKAKGYRLSDEAWIKICEIEGIPREETEKAIALVKEVKAMGLSKKEELAYFAKRVQKAIEDAKTKEN